MLRVQCTLKSPRSLQTKENLHEFSFMKDTVLTVQALTDRSLHPTKSADLINALETSVSFIPVLACKL